MKNLFSTFLLIAVSLHINAQNDNTLLWKVSGNGLVKDSYIFGTMHSQDSRAHEFGKAMLEQLDNADVIMVESDINKDSLDEQMVLKLSMLENTKLDAIIGDEKYKLVLDKAKELMGPMAVLVNYMKPIMTYIMLSQEFDRSEMLYTVDQTIINSAKERNIKVLTMEDEEVLFTLMDAISIKKQAELLVEFLEEYDKQVMLNDSLVNLYRRQELDKMNDLYKSEGNMGPLFNKKLIEERNEKFVAKFSEVIGNQSVFCAVGALHLPGKKGMIQLLRKKGYSVEPVENTYTYEQVVISENREWFNYAGDSLGFEIMFPDDPYFTISKLGLSNLDSLEMLHYYLDDSITSTYMSVLAADISGKSLTLKQLKKEFEMTDSWKLIHSKITEHRSYYAVELEFNEGNAINNRAQMFIRDSIFFYLSVSGYKPTINSNLGDLFFDGFFYLADSVYLHDNEFLRLIHWVTLIEEITVSGDTIFADSSTITEVFLFEGDAELPSRVDTVVSGEELIYDLPLERTYQIIYNSDGFVSRKAEVNTLNFKEESNYEWSFYFTMGLKREKNGVDKNPAVPELFYNTDGGYIDFRIKE